MGINKSDLLKKLSKNFPNFVKKDLSLLIEIILRSISNSLRKNERVELRDVFMFEAKKYKSKYSRNPRTGEKIYVPEKKILRFKMSERWKKKIND
ncbi:MAG: integration host factor subunit beta [Rickettsiales bacterium TMED289]|nr:MAG: integration host factor subunit beta [Rickettsiales bacterium TMED289]